MRKASTIVRPPQCVSLMVSICLFGFSAMAETTRDAPHDDMTAWGNTGALPLPQEDNGAAACGGEARACSWWWPKMPTNADSDNAVWGNGGAVFHCWTMPVAKPARDAPPSPPPPTIICTRPVFNNVLFDLNKAVIRPEGMGAIDAIVAELQQYPRDKVLIEAHTCDLGSREYNFKLGQRRADAVKRYMVEHGIDSSRITTISYGDTQPAVPNDTDANRKLNRRVGFDLKIVQ